MEKSRLLVICALGLGMLMVGCGSKDTQAVKQIEENKVEAVEVIAEDNKQKDNTQEDKDNNTEETNAELIQKVQSNETEQDKVSEDKVSPVRIDMTTTNYEHYLGEIDYVPQTDSFKANQLFGFNKPEEYKEAGSASRSVEEMPDVIVYTESDFSNQITGESIIVGMPENANYLKRFINRDIFTSGEEISDINYSKYILDNLEKGGSIDTIYGTTRIVYQTATNSYSGNVEKSELALFNVNGCDILIKYIYPTGGEASFEGNLEKVLAEMVEE